jgi:hypothetical protein
MFMNKLLPFVLLTLCACGADFRSPVKPPPPPSAAAMQSQLDGIATGVYPVLWLLFDQSKVEAAGPNNPLVVSFGIYLKVVISGGGTPVASSYSNISTSEIMEYDGPPLVEIYNFDNRKHLKVWLPSAHECQP